jgi:hypothetical protein
MWMCERKAGREREIFRQLKSLNIRKKQLSARSAIYTFALPCPIFSTFYLHPPKRILNEWWWGQHSTLQRGREVVGKERYIKADFSKEEEEKKKKKKKKKKEKHTDVTIQMSSMHLDFQCIVNSFNK